MFVCLFLQVCLATLDHTLWCALAFRHARCLQSVLCRFNDHQLFLGFVVHLLWFPLLPDHLLQLLHLLTNRQLQFMLARLLQQWTMNFSFHFSVYVSFLVFSRYLYLLLSTSNQFCWILPVLIFSHCQLCGPVKSWKRTQNPSSGKPVSFGFCEFESAEGILRATRLLNKLSIDGQELVVCVSLCISVVWGIYGHVFSCYWLIYMQITGSTDRNYFLISFVMHLPS